MHKRLKEIRENKELTQSEVAELLKITRQNYSRWETGELLIPLYHLNSLSNIYNYSMDYIMGLTDNNKDVKKIKELNPKLIGLRIKEVRADNNLSIRGLDRLLNTSHSTIIAYEKGKNLIITAFAYQIAKEYKISLDWLVGKSDRTK